METSDCRRILFAAFESGVPVANISERSNDAPYILEGEEFELEWRELQFSPSALPIACVLRPDAYAELERHDAVALTLLCPPLVLMAESEFEILDGWHRIAVAQKQQAPLITLLVAKVPKIKST